MIRTKVDIAAIAYDEQMQTVSVKNCPDALVGFSTFEEAEELAKKYNLEIVSLKKRDGEREWRNEGAQFRAYDVMAFLMERSNCICTMTPDQYEDEEDYMRGEDVNGQLSDMESFDDMISFLEKEKELYEYLHSLDPDEFIFWTDDRYCHETMKRYDVSMSYDVYAYQIALMSPFDYE